MNDKDKEAFLKWYSKETASVLWEDFNGDEIFVKAWQSACEFKQKEIDELKMEIMRIKGQRNKAEFKLCCNNNGNNYESNN